MSIVLPIDKLIADIDGNLEFEHSSCIVGAHFKPRFYKFDDEFLDDEDKNFIGVMRDCIDRRASAIIFPEQELVLSNINHDNFYFYLIDNNLIQGQGYTDSDFDRFKIDSGLIFISVPRGCYSEMIYFDGITNEVTISKLTMFCKAQDLATHFFGNEKDEIVPNIVNTPFGDNR